MSDEQEPRSGDVQEDSTGGVADDADAARIGRREAIKRAAAAAGAAGAVWAAPKVEGLSLVPAYAAAATAGPGHPTTTISIGASGTENNVGSGCNPGNHWWATTQLLVAPYAIRDHPGPAGGQVPHINTPAISVVGGARPRTEPPTPGYLSSGHPRPGSWPLEPATIHFMGPGGGTFTVNAPLGTGIGHVAITSTNPNSDLNSQTIFNVTFNVDPPWNKCRVTEAILRGCGIEGNGANNNGFLNTYNNDDGDRVWNSNGAAAGRPVINNTPAVNPTNFNNNTQNFTATVTVPSYGPVPAYYGVTDFGARQVRFIISCI